MNHEQRSYHREQSSSTRQTPRDDSVEGVIVCVQYADFLEHTLRHNQHHFSDLVVVTDFDDKGTHDVCRRFSVTCVRTDEFYHHGDSFNKGAGINLGLARLRNRGWILQLDADVILPNNFRNMLRKTALNPQCLYGADRVNVGSYEQYSQLLNDCHFQHQHHHCCLVTPPSLPLGSRLLHDEYGYCPIGFFQLWHASFARQHEIRYPMHCGNAEESDVSFALQWPRAQRLLLPTIITYHLESESVPMGTNWNGRKTKLFGS